MDMSQRACLRGGGNPTQSLRLRRRRVGRGNYATHKQCCVLPLPAPFLPPSGAARARLLSLGCLRLSRRRAFRGSASSRRSGRGEGVAVS
eukprot:11144588-Alexandrium_andersonii.AAC.1